MDMRMSHRAGRLARLGFGALVWTACSSVALAADFDPNAEPAALAAAFVKTSGMDALAGAKRAAIAQFRVEFAVENEAKAQSSGTAGWTAVRSDIKLVGIGDEHRQAIADQLYDRFVAQIGAAGLEVIPVATMQANAAYQSLGPVLRRSQEPVGTQTGKSAFVGARGLPTYMSNDDRHLGVGALLGGISTTQPQNIEPEIAKSLDAAVFRVALRVDFAQQSTSGGLFRNGSSVATDVRLALVPTISQVLVVTPTGRARLTLGESVLMGVEGFQLVDVTSDKGVQAAANVITGLLGGGARSINKFEARAEAPAYQAAVLRYGEALQAAMVSAIKPGLAAAR